MIRIKIYYRIKDELDASCMVIKSKQESIAFHMLYRVTQMLDKNKISYIIYCKKGIFSTYEPFVIEKRDIKGE